MVMVRPDMPSRAGLFSRLAIDTTKQGVLNDHYDEEPGQNVFVSDYLRAPAVWRE
jgi:hypothetical protein